jgi:hypothetical protein
MNMKSAIKELKIKLGGEGIIYSDLELSRSQLTQIVEFSLRELTSCIDTPADITVPYEDVIDLSNYKIDSIMWVVRSEPKIGSISNGGVTDPFYASSITTKPGSNLAYSNYSDVLRTQLNYLITSMAQNTVQSDLAWQTNYYNKTLKVTYSGIKPNELTIFYRPIIDSVEDLPSNFWYNYLIRLAVAHAKIIIGEIRGKYTINSGAPITVNTTIRDEGKAELEKIMSELSELARGLAVR